MKKIVVFFAVLMSLLSMTACGGSSENAEATLKNPIDSLSSEEKRYLMYL